MIGDDDQLFDALPPGLESLLERELLAVDIETFWERKDALSRMVPDRGPIRDEHRAARVRAAAVVPAALFEAVVDFLDTEGESVSSLRDVLADWENVRVDPEKLVGHLLVVHGEPPEALLAQEYLDLEERHRALHQRAAQQRPSGQ